MKFSSASLSKIFIYLYFWYSCNIVDMVDNMLKSVDKLERKKITIEIDKNLYQFMVQECKHHKWTKRYFINLCILHKFLNNAR